MNKVLPNNLDIKLKIMSYSTKDDELDIKILPIIGWYIQETYVNTNDEDWDIIPMDAKPIVPYSISTHDNWFYQWNDNTYNSSWELIEYDSIKKELKEGKS